MPVFYSINPAHSSNKPVAIDCKTKVEHKKVAYRVVVPEESGKSRTIFVLKPVVDKVSLLIDGLSNEDKEGLPAWLWGLVEDPACPQFVNAPGGPKSQYKTNVHYRMEHGPRVLIQVDPKKSAPKGGKPPAFMRIEFNPTKLGINGMKEFEAALGTVFATPLSLKQLFATARVSRVDVACDLLNVRSDELVVQSVKPGKSHAYYGKGGKLETVYFAVKKGKASGQLVYNKGRQLSDKGRQATYPGVPHTRIEAIIKTNIKVPKLVDLPNPLPSFDVRFSTTEDAPAEPHVWLLFLDSCRSRGMAAALTVLPEPLKGPYENALQKVKDRLWKPTKLWGLWPQALTAAGLSNLDSE